MTFGGSLNDVSHVGNRLLNRCLLAIRVAEYKPLSIVNNVTVCFSYEKYTVTVFL